LRGRPWPRFIGYIAVTRSVGYCIAITRSAIVVILEVLGVAVLALGYKYGLIAVDLKEVGLLLS
jgi:hypothetical protein